MKSSYPKCDFFFNIIFARWIITKNGWVETEEWLEISMTNVFWIFYALGNNFG